MDPSSPLSSPFPPASFFFSSSHLSLFFPPSSIAPSGRISRCLHRLFYPSHNYSCCHSLRGTCNLSGLARFLELPGSLTKPRKLSLSSLIPREFEPQPSPSGRSGSNPIPPTLLCPVARCVSLTLEAATRRLGPSQSPLVESSVVPFLFSRPLN